MLTWVLLGSGLAAWPAAAALQQSRFFWLGLTLLVLTVLVYLFGTRLLRVARLEGDKVWVAARTHRTWRACRSGRG